MTTEDQITTLSRRLEDGWRRIEEAERQGKVVQDWCDFWEKLLREYELLCDQLAEVPAPGRTQGTLL